MKPYKDYAPKEPAKTQEQLPIGGYVLKILEAKEVEYTCTRCGRMPTAEGYDACLGHIEGATSACCGHAGAMERHSNSNPRS